MDHHADAYMNPRGGSSYTKVTIYSYICSVNCRSLITMGVTAFRWMSLVLLSILALRCIRDQRHVIVNTLMDCMQKVSAS